MKSENPINLKLSLELSEHRLPFDLVGEEHRLNSDDWAWQFLRLNDKYQADYDCVQVRGLEEGSESRLRQFGLLSWVDPACLKLPKRSNAATWFQPLMEPVEATEWDIDTFPEDVPGQSPELSLLMDELPTIRSNGDGEISTSVWYAIDCSVPPAGKLEYVRESANYYRDWFKKEGLKRLRGRDGAYSFLPLDQCKYFDAAGFKSTLGAKDKSADVTKYWRAIRVDVFGPISEQIEKYRNDLENAYHDFVSKKLVEPQFLERLRFFFPDIGVDYGEYHSDGYPLKALVIVGQLHRRNLSDEMIAKFVTQNSCYRSWKEGAAKNWAADLAGRIPVYRKHATRFVEGGYRWLVHAQKP